MLITLILLQKCHKMEVNKSWNISNDKSKNTLRISSIESDYYVYNTGEKLPIDIEIFQNLVDNICRKFDISQGENLLCFGGCAIYNSDGSIKAVENFLPKYPSFLKNWLKINTNILQGFQNSQAENLSLSDEEIQRNVSEVRLDNGDRLVVEKNKPNLYSEKLETNFQVRLSNVKPDDSETPSSQTSVKSEKDPGDSVKTIEDSNKKSKHQRFRIKSGVPVPPRPVLSLNQEDIKEWFPQLIEKLAGKKFPTSVPKKCSEWDADVEKVMSVKDFGELGPKSDLNWSRVSANFYWKLKLVSAILLDKKGIDYTTFAEKVEDKHEKYSIDDLKLMSMSKNPETFEKLFVRKCSTTKLEKPSYIDEFEKKSSEIILQNFRLINARDRKLNGNTFPKSSNRKLLPKPTKNTQIKNEKGQSKSPKVVAKADGLPQGLESTITAVNGENSVTDKKLFNNLMNGIKVTPLIDTDDTSILLCEELQAPKNKRKKSSDSSKEEKSSKVPNQRFLCKNNFQKGDFLIHPSQLHGKFGPVKMVTYRRETKKVFLCVSEFETVESGDTNFVIMEKCSHKNQSTPAKFLDSYIKINDHIEIIDKNCEKMKLKRIIPQNNALNQGCELQNEERSPELKEEIIDLDDLVNDEAFEEELDELNDNEMVIDESSS